MDSPEGVKLGIVRGISYGVFGPPERFMPQLRALGAGLARVYLTWNQIEPELGRFDWRATDALLEQFAPGDEIWITVMSCSRWATKVRSDFLPASEANEMAAYDRFVGALVGHFGGRVAYWQCNNEPSNPGLWSGTADAYAAQARAFHAAVRRADPGARVVLGGCGYDVLSSPEDEPSRAFFAEVLDKASDCYDLFAVHLYDDPRRIPGHIADVRAMMRAHGGEKPVVVGEYGGPTLLEFPKLEPVMQQVMAEAFGGSGPSLDSKDLAARAETPDRRAMRALYQRMASLPPELQMFMRGCPPELESKRQRIACREIVTRNLLALSEGVARTVCWNLGPEVPNYRDPYNLMGFVSDKLALMDFEGQELGFREPAADAFQLIAGALASARSVRRMAAPDGVIAIEVDRPQGPLNVLWRVADPYEGDTLPATPLDWPWPHASVTVTDVFGKSQPIDRIGDGLRLQLAATPLLMAG